MAGLSAFLDEMAREGWCEGERDCLLWLGLWTKAALGIDGAAEWRGTYRTATGRTRALIRSGGMEACISRGADAAGMIETVEPSRGAVGLVTVMTPDGLQLAGAICTGPRWAVLMKRGVLSVRATPLRAWNLP